MKLHNALLRFVAATFSLLFISGCGEVDSGTFVVVNVERGNTVGAIARVDISLELGGQVAMRPIQNDGGELTLPFSVAFQIGHGEGAIAVEAVASNMAGIQMANGQANGTVARGKTTTLSIVLGSGTMGDGGMPPEEEPDAKEEEDTQDAPITMPEMDAAAPSEDVMAEMDQASDEPDAMAPPMGVQLQANRTLIDFGTLVTTSAAEVELTVSNVGSEVSGVLVLGLSGPDVPRFSLRDDTCSGNGLDANASCTVTVRFAPDVVADPSATLTIIALPGGAVMVMLKGTAVAPGALEIDPAAHAFGNVEFGQSSALQVFTVTNGGGETVGPLSSQRTGSDVDEFLVEMDECAGVSLTGGGSCTVAVRFAPTTAGSKNVSLTLSTADEENTAVALLSGRGLRPAALSLQPASHDFGSILQGESSGATTFTLKNQGEIATAIPMATVTGDFAIQSNSCTGALDPGTACDIGVVFSPATPGAKSGSLAITVGDLSATSDLTGTGLSPGDLRIEPGNWDFGTVTVGLASDAFTFTVRNAGQGDSGTLEVSKTGSAAADFQIVSDTCAGQILAGDATCTVAVSMHPTVSGPRAATLQISASVGGNVSSSLTGTGLTPANLSMNPAAQGFGDVVVGTSSDRTFTVSNGGQSPSGAIAVSVSGGDAFSFTLLAPMGGDCVPGTTSLAGGASCTVRVRFAPATPGGKMATLNLSATPGGIRTAGLSGTSLALGQLTANASAQDFGGVEVGANSTAFTWTLTNAGGVVTGPLVLSNSNPSDFSVTNGCTTPLAAGQSCNVSVTFTPSTGGARTGSLSVTATPGGTVTLSVDGRGQYRMTVTLAGGGKGQVRSTPMGIDCAGQCSTLFDPGTTVTLTAVTENGNDTYFLSWSGVTGCSGPQRTCGITVSTSVFVTATFAQQTANLVFTSSKTLSATAGGLDAYHDVCNDLASAAGINTSGHDGFRAWMSNEKISAVAVLGSASGWIRMDGKPFAASLEALTTNAVLHPVLYDENGSASGSNRVMTGTAAAGTPTVNTCNGWTSGNGALMTWGSRVAGPGTWTNAGDATCSTARVYCLGVSKNVTVTVPITQGRLIYLSSGALEIGGGIDAAHEWCLKGAPPSVGRAYALLSDGDVSAAKYLENNVLYVRPDGQAVGTGADIASMRPLLTGIWQQGDAHYAVNQPVLTGSSSPGAAGSAGTTCDGWLSTKDVMGGQVGLSSYTDALFWNSNSLQNCATPTRIYCVEVP